MNNFVLPSSLLEIASADDYSAYQKTYKNVTLKIGLIKAVYEIEDVGNIQKIAPEYDVLAFERTEDRGISPLVYRNCQFIDGFGGIGNFSEEKLTVPSNDPQLKEANQDDGSYVLLLCVDGVNTQAIIIGALTHHNRKTFLTKDAGSHSEREFNGIRMRINKKGEMIITQKGMTDKVGVPTKPLGSQFVFHEDGSIEFNTKKLDPELMTNLKSKNQNNTTSTQEQEYELLKINRTTQSIEVKARKDVEIINGGNFKQATKGNTSISMADYLLSASGKVDINSKSTIDLVATGAFSVKGASGDFKFNDSLNIGAMMIKLDAPKVSVGKGGTPALIMSTQFLGTGNLGAPVVSQAIGPFSTSVTIAP